MKKVILLSEEEYNELLENKAESYNVDDKTCSKIFCLMMEYENIEETDFRKIELFDILTKKLSNANGFNGFDDIFDALYEVAGMFSHNIQSRRIEAADEKGFDLQYHDEYEMGKVYEGNDGIRFKEFKIMNDFVHGRDFWVFRGQKVLLNPNDRRVFTVLGFDEVNFTVDLVTMVNRELHQKTVQWSEIGSCLRDKKTRSYFDYSQMTVTDENGKIHKL